MERRSEEELVAITRDGDPGAYGVLVERHYGRVFAICLSVLGNVQDAEDSAQEALIKGFERIGKLRAGERFGPWIARIAKNLSIDSLRRRKRGRDIIAAQASASSESSKRDTNLESAIGRLPMELRLPLVMSYFDGCSTKNIAEVLGISHAGVCQRLREARKELHRLLTDEGDA